MPTRTSLREKIKNFELSKSDHLKNGRVLSAEMDEKVITSLKIKLTEIISE